MMNAITNPNQLKAEMAIAIAEYMKEHKEDHAKTQARPSDRRVAYGATILGIAASVLLAAVIFLFTSLEGHVRDLRQSITALSVKIDDTNENVNARFEYVNKRIDDTRDSLSDRLDQGNERLDQVNKRLDRVIELVTKK